MIISLAGTRSSEWGEEELSTYLHALVKECEAHSEYQLNYRETSLEYYRGEMRGLPSGKGRSSVVSKDLRAAFRKLIPSVMKTFTGPAGIVNYKPTGPGDDVFADQATDYINQVVVPEGMVEDALYDSFQDAMLLRTGILKWEVDEDNSIKEYPYSGQSSETAAFLSQQQDVEIRDVVQNDDGTLDFVLRKQFNRRTPRLYSVERSSFLIHPNADTIEESILVGEIMYITRSELVEQGYDADLVDRLSSYQYHHHKEEEEAAREGENYYYREQSPVAEKAMEEVLVYEVYVKIDRDGDGIAELYRYILSEGSETNSSMVILDEEIAFEAPYSKVTAEREAHQFEGHSLFDDIGEIQQVKTILLREALDNIYWQNTPQAAVDRSRIINMDAVLNPTFGNPIFLKSGVKVQDAIQWTNVPFVADKTFLALDYMDRVAKDRTGITELSGGVDPEVFEEMKATAAKIVSEASTAMAEQMIRTLAKGVRLAFRGLLRLVVMNADKPRAIRVRGNWVEYDPRAWDMEMDCKVNVGLGSGSADKDLQALALVKQIQTEIMTVTGPNNPFVSPVEIYNTVESMFEVLGIATPDRYIKKPTPEQLQQLAQQKPPPSEAEMKQALEQQKMQQAQQLEAVKLRANLQVERAQMEADLAVKRAEMVVKSQIEEQKSETEREIATLEAEISLLKHREEIALKREELALKAIDITQQHETGELITDDK